ncbi:two-component system, NtrC family, nitrogen regulation response regulator GlnG [Nitrosomonas cryotolerans]|uniref:DNA-binding transcriptional response regulator, NtrC family, contains REC, AAA-type ATPase, and a Fis-type DNA-binding domains n=1 Tax=Nitrosomonas cryotolerans ATCC 49181 TaxID=1131553 RepID=A0A1N6G485_9PROT|nr:sigma-54 dependent transcriptional regulator [Nitrosomonas cryotolerans]SFP52566.1 two-component system, NtrC family, nitrogen regulation response regulator GlnG [Nitrosomonas cryotolerans]SIO02232.1 DNA-binding transcriptional response regulator, NtrC family, contains REC, AAA-type ATPase, and a Fis-type DNA-binding domains [Nitrosomonas cryotolerans ATCC 49181]
MIAEKLRHKQKQAKVSIGSISSTAIKVLIADDAEAASGTLSDLIDQAGFTSITVTNAKAALACTQQEMPDIVLLDADLPDMNGLDALSRIHSLNKAIPVIIITAHGKIDEAIQAIRMGAYDYLTQPFNHQDILMTIRRAIKDKWPARRCRDRMAPSDSLLKSMGGSLIIQRILSEVKQVAVTNFSVLVMGETGVGKDLVAQAIHAESARSVKRFVALDCGAIPDSLIESELFGHEKGAYTGAHQAQMGAFELACGGTLFLDEIGNMPLTMQGKLLRVLETRRVQRIGSTQYRDVDFRIVAATNADLDAMVHQQRFRRDLYHRLVEFTIPIPPLRERTEDFAFLVHRFLAKANKELDKQVKGLSASAWKLVRLYDWPGNVRELRNELQRAVLLCDDRDTIIMPEHFKLLDRRGRSPRSSRIDRAELHAPTRDGSDDGSRGADAFHIPGIPPEPDGNVSLKEMVKQVVAQVERKILLQALELTQGNKAQAARLLRIDYKTIHNKLKTYHISSIQFMKEKDSREC